MRHVFQRTADHIFRKTIELKDKRSLSFFFNEATGLLVIDVVEADGHYGNEIVRIDIPAPMSDTEKAELDALPDDKLYSPV